MEEVFEYRLGLRRRTTWLVMIGIAALIGYALQDQTPLVMGLIWGLTAVMTVWFLSRNPVAGVRVDEKYLTLAAWRDPKMVLLTDIAHLRMTHWTDDSDLILVYKDGVEEFISGGDLPSIQRFSEVMADKGAAIKDPLPPGQTETVAAPPLRLQPEPAFQPAPVQPQDRSRRRANDNKADPRGTVTDPDHAEADTIDYVEEWIDVAERLKSRRKRGN